MSADHVAEPAPEQLSRLAARVPRCRAVDLPPGVWNREGHLDAPVSTSMEPLLGAQVLGFRAGFVHWGFPVVEVRQLLVEGWLYVSFGFAAEPAQVAQQIARAAEVADLVELRATASAWLADVLPATELARREILPGRFEGRSTDELLAGLVTTYDLLLGFAERRYRDITGINLLTSAFLADAAAAGVSRTDAMVALRGSSAATTALLREVDASGDDADELLSNDPHAPALAELARHERVAAARSSAAARAADAAVPAALAAALEDARRAQDVREQSRGLVSRLNGRVRRLTAELGRRLTTGGALDDPSDVWFLGPDELLAVVAGADGGATERQARIRSRRHEFDAASASTPAPSLGHPDGVDLELPAELPPDALRLFLLAGAWRDAVEGTVPPTPAVEVRGIAASPGRVAGPVRVVRHADEVLDVEPGEILVCATTTPAWCIAIATAAGLVAETGGDLSHPAITAREVGIPAVVGVAGATTRWRTGDVITVDGTTGTVTAG